MELSKSQGTSLPLKLAALLPLPTNHSQDFFSCVRARRWVQFITLIRLKKIADSPFNLGLLRMDANELRKSPGGNHRSIFCDFVPDLHINIACHLRKSPPVLKRSTLILLTVLTCSPLGNPKLQQIYQT